MYIELRDLAVSAFYGPEQTTCHSFKTTLNALGRTEHDLLMATGKRLIPGARKPRVARERQALRPCCGVLDLSRLVLLWLLMFIFAMQATWCLEDRVSPNICVSLPEGNAKAVNGPYTCT